MEIKLISKTGAKLDITYVECMRDYRAEGDDRRPSSTWYAEPTLDNNRIGICYCLLYWCAELGVVKPGIIESI